MALPQDSFVELPPAPGGGYPVTVSRETDGTCVVAGPRQPRALAPQVRLWSTAAACSREPAVRGVLVVDAMYGTPALHEVQTLVDDVIARHWGHAKLAWVVLEPSPERRASVAEVWTRLRGIDGRAFLSEAAAREWLAG